MSLSQRLIKIIEGNVGSQRRFKDLEELSGIGVSSWRQVWNERQRPTSEMIEVVAQRWPQYAFWLATGITDPERGHIAPVAIDTFFPVVRGVEQQYATKEFEYLIQQMKLEPIDEEEKKKRKREIEDSVLALREADISPAIYVSYEKVIRALGETGRSEFFIIESNSDISQIRKFRNEEEDSIRKSIKEWRANLVISKIIDKAIKFLLKPFGKKH